MHERNIYVEVLSRVETSFPANVTINPKITNGGRDQDTGFDHPHYSPRYSYDPKFEHVFDQDTLLCYLYLDGMTPTRHVHRWI